MCIRDRERGAGKAALIADLRHGGVGIGEQRFGVFEPLDDDILLGGNPHRVFKDVSEAVVGIIGDIGELFGRDFGEEIFVDVIDRLLQNVLMGGRFIQTGRSALDFHDDVAQKIGNDGNKILPPVLEFRGNEFEVVHHVAVFVRIASRGAVSYTHLEELGWIDKLDENMIANLIVDNRIYGVPRDGYALGLMINKKLFADVGIFYDSDGDGIVDIVDEEGNPLYPTTCLLYTSRECGPPISPWTWAPSTI